MVGRLGGCAVTPRPWLAGAEEAELCLKRCFSQPGSIPSSLEGDAECPFVQDVQPVGGTAGQRAAKQWGLFGRPGRLWWCLFVTRGLGEGSFPLLLLFPLHHNRFQMVLDKN